MAEYTPRKTKLEELAHLIEQDVIRRGLAPGDRYLTAQEAGELFAVHPRQANRAMNLLSERELLMRKAAVGTVIGPAAARFAPSHANGIHLFVGFDRLHTGLRTDALLQALAKEIPGSEIKFNVLPERVSIAEVNEILDRNTANHSVLGVVLLGCDREIQETVAKRHLPAVVFGSVFPTAAQLSSLDLDQYQIGYLLANRLLIEGHTRIAVVTHQVWLPGDNAFVDGIHGAIAKSKIAVPPPTIRACAVSAEVLEAEFAQLASQSEPPTAIICRGPNIAEIALRVADETTIVYDDPDPTHLRNGALCLVEPDQPFIEQAQKIGQLLRRAHEAPGAAAEHVIISVRLTNST